MMWDASNAFIKAYDNARDKADPSKGENKTISMMTFY